MLKKTFVGLFLLGISVSLAIYVYPTHPVLVWSLLGICYVCYLLGIRAQRLFQGQRAYRESSLPSSTPADQN